MSKTKNKYEVQLGPVDTLGVKFLENLIKYVQLGGTVKEGTAPRASFPQSASLIIESSDKLEDEPGVMVFTLDEVHTRKELEEMEWVAFKKAARSKGITGRDRQLMQRQYLQATGQSTDIPEEKKSVAQSTVEPQVEGPQGKQQDKPKAQTKKVEDKVDSKRAVEQDAGDKASEEA